MSKFLISGCGIAGPTTALLLQRIGCDVTILEARPVPDPLEGAFLNLTPNGMAVLDTLGVTQKVRSAGWPAHTMDFHGAGGTHLYSMCIGEPELKKDQPVIIRRAELNRVLRQAAMEAGVDVQFGQRVKEVRQLGTGQVEAVLEDCTAIAGDALLGCDGIHSAVRSAVFPEAPSPEYTGMVDAAGFAADAGVFPTGPTMKMLFGRRAFFGYMVTPTGEVYWFSNHHRGAEPGRGELEAIDDEAWRGHLLDLHRDDPEVVRKIIWQTEAIGRWPIYDLGTLDRWHKGRVCLLGDAAHATSPHVGGGASLALEDAVMLAKCLRDLPSIEQAFDRFQALREERTRAMVEYARKIGQRKAPSTRMGAWIRDRLLPIFLKRAEEDSDWIYNYRIAWDAAVAEYA